MMNTTLTLHKLSKLHIPGESAPKKSGRCRAVSIHENPYGVSFAELRFFPVTMRETLPIHERSRNISIVEGGGLNR